MSSPENYLGQEYLPVDYEHDLSKGQRSYLREQGVSAEDFARLSPLDQDEWLDETKVGAYDSMRNFNGSKI